MTDTTTAAQSAASVSDLTLEEKASLTSGASFWYTKPVDRLGIPSIMVTDGPHGLRKQREGGDHLGLGDSVPATCFPPAVGLGSSWDVDLVHRVGEALGTETSIENVAVLLGPGINIKRSPLCGRNFEYLSEDPIVSGVLGAAIVKGIQSKGVGTSLKHFAANNQEDDRMRSSSDVDARPLREIYLRGFQRVVEDAQPWTVMCSYNRINGVYASEDPWLLTQVLRDEWGFEGLVVSDWGAVNERVPGLAAGMDLEMPTSNGVTDAQIVAAVHEGSLDESVVDTAAGRVLDLVRKAQAGAGSAQGPLDVDAHHALAREAASRSIVLLKNDAVAEAGAPLLPLSKDARLALIGEFAEKPRYQGAGSSMINPTRLDTALDEIRATATGDVSYAQGFSVKPNVSLEETASLRTEAVAAASAADVVVLFLGLPARLESEGYDRTDIDLPADQVALLDAVVAVNQNVVVVLSNGGVVALPFADRVPAILEGWLLGQAGGGAVADVLFGAVNPSAKLTETIPLRLEDIPAFLDFPGEFSHVRYGEGLFVGYRWYDARRMDVAFPFGHGLSYTTFSYGDASASVNARGDIDVTLTVANTGDRAGREVVQVYTSLPGGRVQRPKRELKTFASVALEAGEVAEVTLTVRRKDLAYWDIRLDGWAVEGGDYVIDVAASSRDIRSTVEVTVEGDPIVLPLTRSSSIGEVMAHPVVGAMVQAAIAQMMSGMEGVEAIMPEGVDASKMMESFPIGRAGMFAAGDSNGAVNPEMIDGLIAMANAPQQQG
ncbi:glycoside hydrolase family 3 C-terminal domain-containing protein [Microbacterium flavescens]|uniref:glycoside hydrolase family 3 C-terminal domain-containing protein n=1 Tax=Microbacterium flavescens TaxID=69366 RepID=UPI001BDE32BF|nr:glycoside hydrolase family 3 C-terminal domain-containing protein [Microbacterium flavescens]BFF10006.1 glycoside hydrolase family 3 C-terminal domain-containing protein [Microbacterium flavescens]